MVVYSRGAYMKILGKRLREARDMSGLNQIEASKKLGISNGTLSGYERDYRDPDTEILLKMADLYDVKMDWLAGRSDNPRNSNNDKRNAIINKIATEFPEADLMFDDLANMDADDLEEVYEFIKFKSRKK